MLLLYIVVVCYVATASCSIEVLAYSAYGSSCQHVSEGYVKLNGVVVWQGSYCGRLPNPRGVNILLVDPFSCSVQESRRFDTHLLTSAATELSNYLQLVNHGSIIVGVSADAPRMRLDNALSTLRHFGVEVSDLQNRGSFGFIAQKGFPTKTVLRKVLTEAESRYNPGQFNATITGIQFTVRSTYNCY